MIESLALTQLEFLVHLDRLKWANLDANLAAHANGDINVEDFWVKLWFAHVIGLLVFALYDVNALRWAFLLTNLTRDTTQACVRIVAVINEKWKIPVILGKRISLLRVLHRDQAFLVEITPDKVP